MLFRRMIKLYNSISVQNFAPNSGEDEKKGLCRILVLSQSGISCCQAGITCQKTEGARHILPPLVSDPRGRRPLKIDPFERIQSWLNHFFTLKFHISCVMLPWSFIRQEMFTYHFARAFVLSHKKS